jgi:hypothetical protein
MDRAFERLAEEALADRELADAPAEDDPEKGWYVRVLDALLRLDTSVPEITETRTIVALRSHLERIAIRFSIPPGPGPAPSAPHADIAFGARIESVERQGDAHFRYLLKLPRPLNRDDTHTYSTVLRLAPDRMRPHYAIVPLVRVELFQARIRFDPARLPESVWRFERVAPRAIDDPAGGEMLSPDDSGEVLQEFNGMDQGFGYGIAWRMPPA